MWWLYMRCIAALWLINAIQDIVPCRDLRDVFLKIVQWSPTDRAGHIAALLVGVGAVWDIGRELVRQYRLRSDMVGRVFHLTGQHAKKMLLRIREARKLLVTWVILAVSKIPLTFVTLVHRSLLRVAVFARSTFLTASDQLHSGDPPRPQLPSADAPHPSDLTKMPEKVVSLSERRSDQIGR